MSIRFFVIIFLLPFAILRADLLPRKITPDGNVCKIDIDLSEVFFQNNGMFLRCFPNTLVESTALHYEKGKYIASVPRSIIEDIFGVWWCYDCQNWNSRFDTACFYCGRPR